MSRVNFIHLVLVKFKIERWYNLYEGNYSILGDQIKIYRKEWGFYGNKL